MRRSILLGLGLLFAGGLSCYDARNPLGPTPPDLRNLTALDACTPLTRTQLEALLAEAITDEPSGGPNINALQGGNLNALYGSEPGSPESLAALQVALGVIFQWRDNNPPFRIKDAEKVAELMSAIFCIAGFSFDVDDMNDVFIVQPSNEEQTFTNQAGTAGFIIPPGGLSGPEIITINKLPDNTELNTPLDVWPMIFEFNRTGTGSFPVPWIISVCPGPGVPADVYEWLLLGHQHDGVFNLLPEPGEGQGVPLDCAVDGVISESRLSAGAFSASVARSVVALDERRGPVSGSTSTFSETAPTDRRGGASASTATFTTPDFGVLLDGPTSQSCAASYPAGTDVPVGCRPGIHLRTPNGNALANAMFDWSVTAPATGNPGIAQGTPTDCTGLFLTAHGLRTNLAGETYVCWRLSTTVGTNSVRAAPRRDPDDLTDPLSDPLVVIGEFDESNNFTPKSEWNWSLQGTAETPVFQFSGFLPPIRPLPTVNSVKAGNAVPVKFTLGGAFGLDIFTPAAGNVPGYPQSIQVSCPNGATVLSTEEQTSTAGGSTIGFNFLTDQYTYTWKTEKSWSGTCRELRVRFVHDGDPPQAGYYTALFHFTK